MPPRSGPLALWKMRYSTRLLMTSALVVLLTVGLLGRVLYEIDQNVTFRSQELDGLTYLRTFNRLQRLIQEFRIDAAKNAESKAVLEARINDVIFDLDALEERYGARFKTTDLWITIKNTSARIVEQQGDKGASDAHLYSALFENSSKLVLNVADLSNLQLDRDLDTYYLSITAFDSLAQISKQLADIRTSSRPLGFAFQAQTTFRQLGSKLQRDYAVVFLAHPPTQTVLNPRLEQAQASMHRFLGALEAIQQRDNDGEAEQLIRQLGAEVQADVEDLFEATTERLRERLSERVRADTRAEWLVGTITLVSLVALLTLFTSLYAAIVRATARLRETTARLKLGAGQQSPLQELDERDEVIQAIDLLANTVERHTSIQEQEVARAQRAESAVREATTHVRQILDTSLDAVIAMDSNGLVTEWNGQAETIFQWTAKEAIGASLARLIVPERFRAKHEAGVRRYLETEQATILNKRIEISAIRKSGDEFPIELAIAPLRVGKSLQFNAFIVDITERKRAVELLAAKESAEAASQAKSEFLTTMSHELRTPMNGVLGVVSLLSDTPLNPEQRSYLETISRSGDYLMVIINDILDFSKIEAGKIQLDCAPFDLRALVEETLELLADMAAVKKLELACFVPLGIPKRVTGDAGRLRQVLTNLVGNAIKFTHEGEVAVRVSARSLPEGKIEVAFEISDTGIGIDADGQKRLFQAFSQVDSTTTRDYGGTGLGLAISQRLVRLMGGTIGVRSERNRGSTFFFSIPLPTAADDTPSLLRAGAPMSVLLIDDSLSTTQILESYLAAWGIRTLTAVTVADGVAALSRAAQENRPFDFVFIDAGLPELPTAITALRSHADHAPKVAWLAPTARTRSEKLEFMRDGEPCLVKPIHLSKLEEVLWSPPVAMRTESSTTSASAEALTASATRAHLLVAEDNVINQRIIVRLLEHMGYQVDVAENGLEAMFALEHTPYDAMLLDCLMPKMDGYEVARRVRAQESLAHKGHLPIIAVTANALAGDRERCLAAGMDDYVSKPIKKEVLATVLTKWLRHGTA